MYLDGKKIKNNFNLEYILFGIIVPLINSFLIFYTTIYTVQSSIDYDGRRSDLGILTFLN